MRRYVLLNIFLNMCLQIIDGLQTYYAITKLGDNELNPIVNHIMMQMGVGFGLIAVKMCVLILLIFLAIVCGPNIPYLEYVHKSKFLALSLTIINIIYIFVVGYGIYSIISILKSP